MLSLGRGEGGKGGMSVKNQRGAKRAKIMFVDFGREAAEGLGSKTPLKGGFWTQPAARRVGGAGEAHNSGGILAVKNAGALDTCKRGMSATSMKSEAQA